MLQTETYALGDEIETLNAQIADLQDDLDGLEEGTDAYRATADRKSRLQYFKNGLVWQRDEADWGDGAEITLGALNALEEAEMDRHVPDHAGQKERRLWFVAASTVSAPNVDEGDGIETAFAALDVHPGYALWVEAKTNSLGVPDAVGNGSSTSSRATEASATSTAAPNGTTTSSSDSHTD